MKNNRQPPQQLQQLQQLQPLRKNPPRHLFVEDETSAVSNLFTLLAQ